MIEHVEDYTPIGLGLEALCELIRSGSRSGSAVSAQGPVFCPPLWAGSAITFSPRVVADSEIAAIGNTFSQVYVQWAGKLSFP